MEQYFIKTGYLYPYFHKDYWMGLQTNSINWPSYKWLDAQSKPPLTSGSFLLKPYTHGGRMLRTQGLPAHATAELVLLFKPLLTVDTSAVGWIWHPAAHVCPLTSLALSMLQGTNQPNNNDGFFPSQYCAMASAVLSYASAWGWDDEACENAHIFICRTRRKQLLSRSAASNTAVVLTASFVRLHNSQLHSACI